MSEEAPLPKFATLGAYGFSESAFFTALQRAGVDTFCDIRYRRGVRGAEYAFVNSVRLQKRLTELDIRYLHFRDLAPSPSLRARQSEVDKAEGTTKRKRSTLGDAFVSGYHSECLTHFDSRKFVGQLGDGAKVVALFCVEREPAACHRSLLAEKLRQDLGAEIVHLLPD